MRSTTKRFATVSKLCPPPARAGPGSRRQADAVWCIVQPSKPTPGPGSYDPEPLCVHGSHSGDPAARMFASTTSLPAVSPIRTRMKPSPEFLSRSKRDLFELAGMVRRGSRQHRCAPLTVLFLRLAAPCRSKLAPPSMGRSSCAGESDAPNGGAPIPRPLCTPLTAAMEDAARRVPPQCCGSDPAARCESNGVSCHPAHTAVIEAGAVGLLLHNHVRSRGYGSLAVA